MKTINIGDTVYFTPGGITVKRAVVTALEVDKTKAPEGIVTVMDKNGNMWYLKKFFHCETTARNYIKNKRRWFVWEDQQ